VPLTAQLIDDASALEAHGREWDRLAVDAGRPYCAPGWMLAWWRAAAPEHARLRAVVVCDGEQLAGVAPFWIDRAAPGLVRYRLLGAELSARVEPLAAAGRERDVAAAVADELASAEPGYLRFEGLSRESEWPELVAGAWGGGRAWLHRELPIPAPKVELGDSTFEAWFAGRSSNFRQQVRRKRRKLDSAGAVFRRAGQDELERDLQAFARLHHERWDWRGGSSALNPGIERMLLEAGRGLVDENRFRLYSIEIEGEIVSSHLFVAAGREVSYWNGGFDARWHAHSPSLHSILQALEEALELGEGRLDLGPGGQEYKYRLADGEDQLEWHTLVPPGPRYALARARLAPYQAKWALSRRLSAEHKEKLKRLLRRS
jgi:CelD/BcsL family acetyltransferase involved in cellulose biosynthesis